MAVEVERLVVKLEADLSKYNSNLAKGQAETASKLAAMEQSFQKMAATAKVSTGAAGSSVMSMTAAMSVAGKAALNSSVMNERLIKGMTSVGGTAQFTAAAIQKMPPALRATAAAMNTSSVAAIAATGNFSKLASAGNGMGTMFAGIGAALGVSAVVEYANAWTRVERSLDGQAKAFGITLRPAKDMTRLANEARADLEDYATLYTRTSAAIRDYGYAAGTAETVTSTLSKAMKIGGATASEQASTIRQFSQSLNKGRLNGDELVSTMENAPLVMELLSKRLGVTKGEILDLAKQNKIQFKELIGAMVDGAAQVDRIYRQMPITIDEAFTVLKNNVTEFLGNADKATGATQAIVAGITTIGQNLGAIAVAAGAILSSAALRMVAFAAASIAAANPLTVLVAVLGGLATAYGVFGDNVKLSSDGVISMKDAFSAFIDVAGGSGSETLTKLTDMFSSMKAKAAELGLTWENLTGTVTSLFSKIKSIDEKFGGFGAKIADVFITANSKLAETLGIISPITFALEKGLKIAERAREISMQRSIEEKNLGGGLADFYAGKKGTGKVITPTTKPETDSYTKEVDQIKKRTEALRAELATIGKTTFAKEKAKAVAELTFAAQQAAAKEGKKYAGEHAAAIDEMAWKYAKLQSEVEFLNKLQSEKDATDTLKMEVELAGLSGEALSRARREQELLNEAKRAGRVLDDPMRARIAALAEENAHLEKTRDTIKEVNDLSKDAMKGFISDLREGKSAADALANAIDKIADKLLDSALDGLFGSKGGIGDIIKGIISPSDPWAASVTTFAQGGIAANGKAVGLPKFAAGGVSKSAAIFGEAGPEAAVPLPDGRRIPVDLRMPNIPTAVPASGGATVLTVSPVFNVQNGTPDGVEKMKSEIVPLIRAVVQREVPDMFDRNPRFAKLKT